MEERTYLSGTSLAGMSPTRSRVENDYLTRAYHFRQLPIRFSKD